MSETAPSRPNVVWIFGDQHRGQMMSCAGDPNLNTPNLDRLASDGRNFTRAVAGFPLCCPFRGSLLTSRYPHECVPGHEYPLPPEMPTVANVFREHGYHTAYFGKWHLDGFHERDGRAGRHIVPPGRRGGFDAWTGYENNNSQWDTWVHGGGGNDAFQYRLPGYETDALTDLLLGHLRDQAAARREGRGRPFFAVLSVQPPHDPYLAPPEFMARHHPATVRMRPNVPEIPRVMEQARREYAGACAQVENLDANVGRVMDLLRETDLLYDTHVLFFSDHGDMHGSQGQLRKTAPWEESIRIPFLVGGLPPRYATHNGACRALVNHVDIAPTSLGLCGIAPPAWMRGADLSGHRLLRRPQAEPDSAFLQCVVPTGHGFSIDRPWRGVVTADGWKYVAIERQPWLLFNLNEDPYEQANLAFNTHFRAERKRLQDRLAQWIADTGDRFELPPL